MISSLRSLIPQSIKNQYHRVVAILATLYYGHPAKKLTVIGVTGTDGKTTTTTLIYYLLKSAGYNVACVSSVAAYIGDRSIDTGFHVTTPNSWMLQRLIRRIVDQGYTHLVLEVTSHGLDQSRVLGTNIRYVVITNVTHEHLDYHHTMARYIAAKAKIFAHAKVAVLNADDDSYPRLKPYVPKGARLLSYSLSRPGQWGPIIALRFPETYNQSNALAAITLCHELQVKASDIRAALVSFPGVIGRGQAIPNSRKLKLIVDFAHTPNALLKALTALKPVPPHKLIAVYGAAGERDKSKRPQMGQVGSVLADEVVLTSEDPRSEDPKSIIRQLKSGIIHHHGHVHAIVDRKEAIEFALNLAKAGDTVGIFGKGHEQSLNLDGRHEIPWSDIKVAQQLGDSK
jgi:UDP-N-acetylmuramoyl-L-alanyl-D-glutamate--2,6-diaminopimelate ligase